MADWCQLPTELLQLISEKLNCELYLLRFRSVCSTWRFSIPKPNNHFPLNLTHFFNSNNNDSIIRTLYKHNIFLIKPPTATAPNQQTLYRPLLVRISPTSTGKFKLWHPLLFHHCIPFNLLDFNQLSVFHLGHMYTHDTFISDYDIFHSKNVIVAMSQGGQPLDILTRENYSGELLMFRSGDDHWKKIPNVAKSHRVIFIFKGRPCVTDETGRTVMIQSDLSIHLVAEPVFGGHGCGILYIMVENESDLLLVHKYKDDCDGDEPVRIDVFRLYQKEKKWVKLTDLGNRVLFLGQGYSFTASASDLGFDNGNFVIYCNKNDNVFRDSELSVFHLDQRHTFPLSDYSDYVKLFWPPPEWIISRCHRC